MIRTLKIALSPFNLFFTTYSESLTFVQYIWFALVLTYTIVISKFLFTCIKKYKKIHLYAIKDLQHNWPFIQYCLSYILYKVGKAEKPTYISNWEVNDIQKYNAYVKLRKAYVDKTYISYFRIIITAYLLSIFIICLIMKNSNLAVFGNNCMFWSSYPSTWNIQKSFIPNSDFFFIIFFMNYTIFFGFFFVLIIKLLVLQIFYKEMFQILTYQNIFRPVYYLLITISITLLVTFLICI